MININELRIGNLIDDPHNDGTRSPVTVVDIYGKWQQVCYRTKEDEHCTAPIADIDGIPLTEDWLVKFGFESTINKAYWQNKDIKDLGLTLYFGRGSVCIMRKNISASICYKYIHELQNLHFALTGEELKLTK